ncbi:MAG TPA: alkaline phosphatase family protein [Thermoanaerobaculia bacterium]|nr:alkaline phosphatase family protein [Thermoanaerobaculia bacterium]
METSRPLLNPLSSLIPLNTARRLAVLGAAGLAVLCGLGCRGESGGRAAQLGPLAVPAVARAAQAGRPVIFVGWDGADWQLLDAYLAAGGMPNLAALVREGRSGVLVTQQPPLSPLVWTTMMTGVSPLVHGILDFTRFDPQTGERGPITSAERRVPAVWNMAAMAGRSAAVFGLWATWPAETVAPGESVLVSDRLFSFQNAESAPPPGVVSPASEEAWARNTLAATEKAIDFAALQTYLPWLQDREEYQRLLAEPDPYARPASALRRILIETAVYDRLAEDWLSRHHPELAIVYFQGSDAIGHIFAPFAPPRQPAIAEADFARWSGVPELYFADLDRRLGEYRRLAAARGAVLVLASDHGFRWREGRPERLASAAAATAGRWHRDEGIYLLWGPGIAPRAEARGHGERGSVRQVAATLLALLGLPPGEGLYGPPLPGVPAAGGAGQTAVRYAAYFHPAAQVKPAAGPGGTGDKGGGEELAKLRALGYVGASEPGRARPGSGGDATRTAGSFNNEGLLLLAENRPTEAQEAFERALSLDPRNASALANLSDLLVRSGARERADALLAQALEQGLPDAAERVLARAAADRGQGVPQRSLPLLDRALALRPERTDLRLARGRLRMEGEDCRGAAADFAAAEAAAPGLALAWGSEALARLCLGDRATAIRALERSLALDPQQPEVARTLAQLRQP